MAAPKQPEGPLSADPVSVAAMEIEDTIQKLMAEEMPQAAENRKPDQDSFFFNDSSPRGEQEPDTGSAPEEELADDGEEDSEPTRRIDFDNLQFGRDFEIR